MATLKDVAERAGVSVATVSHVLNGTKAVSAEVRERVLDAAAALDYRRNRPARTLRTGRSQTLGLVIPDLTNPFFPELAQAVESHARALGYALLLIDTQNDPGAERQGFELLGEHGVEGVIWVPISDRPGTVPDFPVVTIDRPLPAFDAVHADHRQGGALLGRYATALGHRRLGLLAGPQALTSARLRREGLLAGVAGGAEIVWQEEVPFSLRLPDAAVRRLRSRDVSLVVCASDVVAIAALQALADAGIEVPDDVSLLGFDDIPWAALVRPALTTVRQPLAAIGTRAVERLRQRIADPGRRPHQDLFAVELVPRGSARSVREPVP